MEDNRLQLLIQSIERSMKRERRKKNLKAIVTFVLGICATLIGAFIKHKLGF